MDLETLQAQVRAGKRLKYVFFWGHRPRPDGTLGTSCFSQWWPAEFTVDDRRYSSAEHYMMAGKARLFGDDEMLQRILAARSPGAAKKLGRQVRGFSEERWAMNRFDIVVAGNIAKFGQNEDLKAFLLGTKQRVLVEASPRDRVWGIGLSASDDRAKNPLQWRGLNLLGFALMQARQVLSGGT